MVPVDSGRISPVPPYSGYPPCKQSCVYGAITRYGHVFQTCSTCIVHNCAGPTTPSRMRDGLGCSAFARHYLRNHCCFLFLRVLRCFSSPGFSPPCGGSPAFSRGGCPIRTPADQRSFAPPRSFSQLTASFVISESQGIPHAPLSRFLSFGGPCGHLLALPPLVAHWSRPPTSLSFSPVLSMNFLPAFPVPPPPCTRRAHCTAMAAASRAGLGRQCRCRTAPLPRPPWPGFDVVLPAFIGCPVGRHPCGE
jgi:hypothetical protein